MSETPTWVLERIEEARRRHSLNLELYRAEDLAEFPEEIFELKQLETLYLRDLGIRRIPARIRELSSLKRLNLVGNPLEALPDVSGLVVDWETILRCECEATLKNVAGVWIVTGEYQHTPRELVGSSRLVPLLQSLPNLRDLYIGAESLLMQQPLGLIRPTEAIAGLIGNIGSLRELQNLTTWGVLLDTVPSGIRELRQLNRLSLGGAGLKVIPSWLSELGSLSNLGLSCNELVQLPDSLADLSQLDILDLSDNSFTEFPGVVWKMTSLHSLNLSVFWEDQAHIKQIPLDIIKLRYLTDIDVSNHPIETPPPEVVKEGAEAIRNYWRQQQEVGVDYLCEAKLLIVGEAGAGKSSLARKLKDSKYKLTPPTSDSSTEGIEITRWNFQSAVRVKDGDGERLIEKDFWVNSWDFGGQEVYHATHQFFLTRRSLYLLVADDRKEDTDFNYWLAVVELLSDSSPVLIVQNEKQGRKRDIDINNLRSRFSNVRDAYQINLADNSGLAPLATRIKQELEQLPQIGVQLPATWKRVREVLEKDSRNYIGVDEYLNICQTYGFKRQADKMQLSGYLHDLGICLHFQDDPVLKQTLILKPRWGTDAVYRVLDNDQVIANRGRFGPEDLNPHFRFESEQLSL